MVWGDDDTNLIHKKGAFTVMYAPEDYAKGIEAAHAWIDAYYAANPESLARYGEQEASRAATSVRQAAKRAARQAARATNSSCEP